VLDWFLGKDASCPERFFMVSTVLADECWFIVSVRTILVQIPSLFIIYLSSYHLMPYILATEVFSE
jgi:hypothetical protein